ncbi:MAG: hypothetical protein IIZ56_02590 [Clostridia bacterium]|nr:hypothetical protein [Clostridia bacterium]MBR6109673.1 hypothetical protein [Clostridia bacterium]
MEEDRCTLFSFMTGNVFAAVLHILCGLSGWCCLVFPLLSVILFLVEKNGRARVACLHTIVVCVVCDVLAFVPVVLWLIIRAITHCEGVFYVFCTVMFAAVMLILWFALLAIQITCAVKSLKGEPVEVPFITAWVAKLAAKVQ